MTEVDKSSEDTAVADLGSKINTSRNPLNKVAALTISRTDKPFDGRTYHNLSVTLNFKRGDGLSDSATTKTGEEVFVTFDMSVSRASLAVKFSRENGDDDRRTVDIREVAFQKPLSAQQSIKEKQTISSDITNEAKIRGGTSVGFSLLGANAKAETSLRGDAARSYRAKNTITSTTSQVATNITATNTSNKIDWSISPPWGIYENESQHHPSLEGEVFLNAKTLKAIPACKFKVHPSMQAGELIVTASVMVRMTDIHLHAVSFADRYGNDVRLGNISQPTGSSASSIFGSLVQHGEKKERILKQIIRKRLEAEGMQSDGASIEICKAFT